MKNGHFSVFFGLVEAMISKAEHDAALAEKQGQINALRHELDQLKRLIFAAKSERFSPVSPPEQMELFARGTDAGAEEEAKQTITYERKKKKAHPGRLPLPDHFPVRRQVIEPEEDTTGMVKIGEEITRKVNYTPGTMEIIETVRPKYARPEAEQSEEASAILIAPVVEQVLPKAIAGVGLLVQIMIAKYVDHLPLYRQRQMIKRDFDWDIPPSTFNDWFASSCTLLEPLYQALLMQVLTTDYLQGDESRLTVLEYSKDKTKSKSHRHPPKERRKSHLGYMWVFRDPVTGAVVFAYRPGRGANVLHETLANFSGRLQSDGYSAYTSFLKKHKLDVELVSCLAHIRRKFFDAQQNHPEMAELALRAIQYLYDLERSCSERKVSAEIRQRFRRRFAKPAYKALLQWVSYHHRNNLSKGGIGKALHYANNHLPRLSHYLEDGRIEIDNNQIENKIRPLALGRKNYLFAGSHKAAQRAAMMYSFFATCKEHDVNPRVWLTDVLLRIRDTRPSRMEELLPGRWKKKQEEGV